MSLRPKVANAHVVGITRSTFNLEVIALSPDTTDIRDSIETAIESLLLNKEPYILGLSTNRNDFIKRSEMISAVSDAIESYGATFDDVTLKKGTLEISSEVLSAGEKAKLGTISYV